MRNDQKFHWYYEHQDSENLALWLFLLPSEIILNENLNKNIFALQKQLACLQQSESKKSELNSSINLNDSSLDSAQQQQFQTPTGETEPTTSTSTSKKIKTPTSASLIETSETTTRHTPRTTKSATKIISPTQNIEEDDQANPKAKRRLDLLNKKLEIDMVSAPKK